MSITRKLSIGEENIPHPFTGITAGATCSFDVRAYDAAANQSAVGNICGVTLPDSVATMLLQTGNSIQGLSNVQSILRRP